MMYVGKKQYSWDKWLYMIEFAYNDHLHSIVVVIQSMFYMVRNVSLTLYFLLPLFNLKILMKLLD